MILSLRSQLNLHTRCENQVENEIDRRDFRAGDVLACEEFQKRYPNATHRPCGPSRKYNCHGLTFAARRTWIWKASEIAKVLRDDEYQEVDLKEILPGDIAVYYSNGDAEHSGVVMRTAPVPVILSKWGVGQEVLHNVNDCPYDSSKVVYYRIRT